MKYFAVPVLIGMLLLLGPILPANAAPQEEALRLNTSTAVLQDVMRIPEQGIPADLIRSAYGIAVFPDLIKFGLGIGRTRGNGVLVVRRADGSWSDPSFLRLSGGSLGFQAGVASTDLILVFRTARGLQQIERGKLTLGGTISIAAGPIGRTGQAATDSQLRSEILSYSRSRGLFAGVAIEGASLKYDFRANEDFFGVADPIRTQMASIPPAARNFMCVLSRYSGAPTNVCA